MKKYFKFTSLRKDWKGFAFCIMIAIVCQCYNGWSINDMMKSDFVIATAGIFGSLIADWVKIRNDSLKNKSVEE